MLQFTNTLIQKHECLSCLLSTKYQVCDEQFPNDHQVYNLQKVFVIQPQHSELTHKAGKHPQNNWKGLLCVG